MSAEGSVLEVAVSPNGQTIAAVVTPNHETAGGYIATFSMSTGALISKLTNGTTDEDPAWSPDGTQLVFARGDSLYTTSASGSPGTEKLLVNEGDAPTWGGSEAAASTPTSTTPGVILPALQSATLGAHTVRAKSGLKLRVTLSAAGSVVVEFKLISHHHRHELLKLVGSVTLTGKQGANSFTIKRVHGHLLAPGAYQLVVFTEAGTTKSAKRTLTLTVERQRSRPAGVGQRGDVFQVDRTPGGSLHADQVVATRDGERQVAEPNHERTLAQLVIGRRTGDLVQHVDCTVIGGEMPQRRTGQRRGVDLLALAPGVEDPRVEGIQSVSQVREIDRLRPRQHVDVDRRSHVPVRLHGQPADDHVVD